MHKTVQINYCTRFIGACEALGSSSKGFVTSGNAVSTMVRFQNGSTSLFTPSQCRGLKMGLTTLQFHGMVEVDDDRVYKPMTIERLGSVTFLNEKTRVNAKVGCLISTMLLRSRLLRQLRKSWSLRNSARSGTLHGSTNAGKCHCTAQRKQVTLDRGSFQNKKLVSETVKKKPKAAVSGRRQPRPSADILSTYSLPGCGDVVVWLAVCGVTFWIQPPTLLLNRRLKPLSCRGWWRHSYKMF